MVCISFWQILGFFQFIVFIIFNIHEMYLRMQEESELSESKICCGVLISAEIQGALAALSIR